MLWKLLWFCKKKKIKKFKPGVGEGKKAFWRSLYSIVMELWKKEDKKKKKKMICKADDARETTLSRGPWFDKEPSMKHFQWFDSKMSQADSVDKGS